MTIWKTFVIWGVFVIISWIILCMSLSGNGLVYVWMLSIFFILEIYTDLYKKVITIFMTFVVYKHNTNNILRITKHYAQMYND